MAVKTIAFTVRTAQQAKQLYGSGLKHKILTLPEVPGAVEGEELEVALALAFSGEGFHLLGRVVHSGAMATVVQVNEVPQALYQALGVPGGGAGERMPAVLEQTTETEPGRGSAEPRETVETAAATEPLAEESGESLGPDDDLFADESGARYAETVGEASSPSLQIEESSGDEPSEGASYSGEFRRVPTLSRVETLVPEPPAAARPRPAAPRSPPGRAKAEPRAGGYVSARASQAPAPREAPPPGDGVPVPGQPNQVFAGTPREKGTLANVAMREVFMDLLNRKATGLLVVDGFRERYWGYFIDGQPIRYTREPPSRSESIEYQASRQRLLKPAEIERARYAAGLTGLQLDDALVRLGLLNRQQVDALMVEASRMITDRLLGVNFGTFRFFDLPEVKKLVPGTPVGVAHVLWDRSRARYTGLSEKQVREIVDQFYKHHLVLTDGGRQLAEPLIASLAGQEQRFLKRYLRGGWQLAELLGRLEMPTRSLIQLVLSMQDLGVIELNEREGARWREARAERYIIDRMDYMEKDHFAFVEAHWSCLEPELIAACDKVARTIEDPMMDQLELEKLSLMREQIRAKLAEVRELFRDKTRRRQYRNELVEMGKRRMAGELFGKQGEMEIFKGDLKLARECFERVLELDPRDSGSSNRIRRAKSAIADLSRGAKPQVAPDLDLDDDGVDLEELDKL